MKNLKLLSLGLLLFLSIASNFAFLNKAFADSTGNVDGKGCVSISRNLKYRWWWYKDSDANTNGEVSILQDFLSNNGYYTNVPNGIFDLTTKTAVRKFQNANSLNPDGSVGPLTRDKLNTLYGCESLRTSTVPTGSSDNAILDNKNSNETTKPSANSSVSSKPLCHIDSFTASPNPVTDLAYIAPETKLSWKTRNCDVVYMSGGAAPLGVLPNSGNMSINTPQTTTYTLYASTIYNGTSGNTGLDNKSIVVTVKPGAVSNNAACKIDSFAASPNPVHDLAYIKPETKLSWETSNCDVVYMSGGAAPLGTLSRSGSVTLNTPQTTTFTLHASTIYNGSSGNTGLDNKNVTVTVIPGN